MQDADNLRSSLDFDPIGEFAVKDGPKSGDLLARNIHSYLDTFSSRQLLYLHHAIRLLQELSGAVKLNLGLLVSTSLEFNSLLCGYKGWAVNRPGAIRHVFALHAYSFPYTALENNPINLQKSSGNLQQLFGDRIERGRNWAVAPVERRIGYDGVTQQVKIPGEYDGGVKVFDQARKRALWLIAWRSRPIADRSLDGEAKSGKWAPLSSIDSNDSETFCRQCGAALGWLLESPLSHAEIRATWREMIQGVR